MDALRVLLRTPERALQSIVILACSYFVVLRPARRTYVNVGLPRWGCDPRGVGRAGCCMPLRPLAWTFAVLRPWAMSGVVYWPCTVLVAGRWLW